MPSAMSDLPPPPPRPAGAAPPPPRQREDVSELLDAVNEIQIRLARLEGHAKAARAYLGWIVFFFIVLPLVLGVIALLIAAGAS
jgi:hypothetical protein